ncbi:DUF4833 domain-containing protein [Flavobacterium sp. RNTU_13]|uniref:DUF4833 domain-containing protein n=1 Tax=Flavobacterium sp. RNTU_13 TaxID=3375145 RepID=UPI0039878C8E
MKKLLTVLLLFFMVTAFTQQGYPVPPAGKYRLFYIQHSNNHNTFVYDLNITASGKINTADPIDVYRLTYERTKKGVRDELSPVQRKMAYGITVTSVTATQCSFTLAAYPEKILTAKLGADNVPHVFVSANGKNLMLGRLFLQMGKLPSSVEYIDFYGKDMASSKEAVERFYIKD